MINTMDMKIVLTVIYITLNSENVFSSIDAVSNEFCLFEPFIAKCTGDEVIVMKSALYGFMGTGRCVSHDFGVNCSVDVLRYLDERCSWKSECQYNQGNFEKLDPCLDLVKPYLMTTYACISVETSDMCSSSSTLHVSRPSGTISSAVAKQSGCGSVNVPWVISLKEGEKVDVTLVDFLASSTQEHLEQHSGCTPLGFIFDIHSRDNITICASNTSSQYLYTADTSGMKLQLLADSATEFLLEYKVTGCMDLVPPDFAWYQRSGDNAVIGCQYRNMTWSLHCDGYRWNGVVGRCNDTTTKSTTQSVETTTSRGYQYLLLVAIVAVFLIVIIICVTVGILKLIDRSKQKEAARRQLLIDSNTSQEYARGNQMTMRPMYAERAEMVPDILESSLPRPHHMQYPPPESESSYGTNYPGTMYYMGAHNYSNMGPQSHQRDTLRDSRDYETVTLPKKPETVSDSESEDLYATIPPY